MQGSSFATKTSGWFRMVWFRMRSCSPVRPGIMAVFMLVAPCLVALLFPAT